MRGSELSIWCRWHRPIMATRSVIRSDILRHPMLPVFARISVTVLCMIGLLVQSLGGGLSSGVLCIGCERTGWTITGPESQTGPRDCCDDESESNDPSQQDSLKLERRCGCVSVPLTQGIQFSVISPRLETQSDVIATAVLPNVTLTCAILECQSEIWTRAGPTHPPRLLSPSSRRTVLVI